MKIVLASNNPGKLREIREIMAESGIEVLSQREAGCEFEAEETGRTFDENARIKALAAMRATGLPAAADDSGLEVNAMNGGPGIYSSRFCGERTYADACREIISIVDKNADRGARYCCAVVCCFPDGREVHCFATTEGEIAHRGRAFRQLMKKLKDGEYDVKQ